MARKQKLGQRYASGQSPIAKLDKATDEWRQNNVWGDIATGFIPGIGQIGAYQDVRRAVGQGNYGMAALSSLGMIPFLGAAIKPIAKGVRALTKGSKAVKALTKGSKAVKALTKGASKGTKAIGGGTKVASKGTKAIGNPSRYASKPSKGITINGEKFDAAGIKDAMDDFIPNNKVTQQQIQTNLDQGKLPYNAAEAVGQYADNPADVRAVYNQLSKQGVQGSLAPRGIGASQSGLITGMTDDIMEEGFDLVNTATFPNQAVMAVGKTPQQLAIEAIQSGVVNKTDESYRAVAALAAARKANPALKGRKLLFHGSDNPQLLKDMKNFAGGDYSAGLGLGGQNYTFLGDSPLAASAAKGGFGRGKGVMISSADDFAGHITQVPRQVGTKITGGANQIVQNSDDFINTLSNSDVFDMDLSSDAIEKSISQFDLDPTEILKWLE